MLYIITKSIKDKFNLKSIVDNHSTQYSLLMVCDTEAVVPSQRIHAQYLDFHICKAQYVDMGKLH